MPIFECPRCGKQDLVPLAMCERMLDSVPYLRHDAHNNPIYSFSCPDCRDESPPAVKAIEVVHGDLLDQPVDAIVNAWNRNVIPWWLLLPQGVSGAIKRRAGTAPFRELRRHGAIPLGGAVITSAGKLPFKAIIHVAGINLLWRASERSIRDSVRNAVRLAAQHGFRSLAIPLIGASTGGFGQDQAQSLILDELQQLDFSLTVKVVVYGAPK